MSRIKYHFFVCTNMRPPFIKPSCANSQSNEILFRLRELVEQKGLREQVKISGTDCLGPCDNGPIIVVYPEATWYSGVQLQDVEEIVEGHVINKKPVERLFLTASA